MKTPSRFVLFVLLSALMSGCATHELKNSENPEVVYNEAVRFLEKRSYLEATEYLQEVRRRFPQSRYAVLAELRSADIDFAQDNFIEAAAGYGVFVDLYPNHADAPYALYRRVLSYYNAAPNNIARDQSSARDAIRMAQFFGRRYPNSPYSKEISEILTHSRLKLATKEAYVARFYQKKSYTEASLRRWQSLLSDYADVANTDEGSELFKEAQANIVKLQKEMDS